MSNNDLYKSATDKLQKLHDLIYDENGNIRPEFSLTDEELKAFRDYSDESGKKEQFEVLFGGIIYDKGSHNSEAVLENIYDMSSKIYELCVNNHESWSPNYVYTKSASNWDGNVLFSADRNFKSIKISLYNLNDKFEHVISLSKDPGYKKIVGFVNIFADRRIENSTLYSKNYGAEYYDLREQGVMDILLACESELVSMLSQLTQEVDNKESGVRR